MSDRPILFSTPMVRALSEGRKTQTRRLRYSPKTGKPTVWANVRPGDRLWVREGFAIMPKTAYHLPKTVAPATVVEGLERKRLSSDNAAYYRADFDRSGRPLWKPSIHMPRWASRLTLKVARVHIETLDALSHSDALAEGVSSRDEFFALWNQLHGPGASMDNPLVVAVSFFVDHCNIDQMDQPAASGARRG